MTYALIALSVIMSGGQTVFSKLYVRKYDNGMFFVFLSALSSEISFIIISGFKLSFNLFTLELGAAMGVTYIIGLLFNVLALSEGPLSLTTLFISYSLIIPAFYGIIFKHEKITVELIVGIIFLLLSIYLINCNHNDKKKISTKWVVCVSLAMIGNGFATIAGNIHQTLMRGQYINEFMIVAMAVVAPVCGIICLLQRKKHKIPVCVPGAYLPLLAGIINALLNLFMMLLVVRMNASVLYPLISAGTILISCMISRFGFSEEISKTQYAGIAAGLLSVIFLNI